MIILSDLALIIMDKDTLKSQKQCLKNRPDELRDGTRPANKVRCKWVAYFPIEIFTQIEFLSFFPRAILD